jgi:hypothetical protein
MRTPAIDDFDVIGRRMREIAETEVARCRVVPERTLFNCLRSPGKCPEACPDRADWLGPNEDGTAAWISG